MTCHFYRHNDILNYFRELEKNYYKCHCHYLLTNKIADGLFDSYMSNLPRGMPIKKKSLMELHTIFLSMIFYIHWWKYWWNEADKLFLRVFAISKFISKIIPDKLQITDENFFNGLFLSISPSVKFVSMACKYKYRHKVLSINLKILVVFYFSNLIIIF